MACVFQKKKKKEAKTPHTLFSVLALNYSFLCRIFFIMLIGKKLMLFSFTVNSHSRSRFLLIFSAFSIQLEEEQFRIQKGMLVVNQGNVFSWY